MGLTADLNTSMEALLAATESMDVTSTNIANMNTPGYARRTVVLEESAPADGASTGVDVEAIQSTRDNVLDLAVNSTTAQQSYSETVSNALGPVQTLFSDTASGSIGSSIDSFFDALQQLSTSPSDGSLSSNALTAAQNVASAFQTASSTVTQAQQQADQSVVQSTTDANSLLQQIAETNAQITTDTNLGRSDNADEDQLSNLLTQLSSIMGYQTSNSSNGLTLTTSNGTPLVVGDQAYALTNSLNANGYNDVYAGGVDITSSIQGGSLAGDIQVRDQTLTAFQTQLDQYAFQFAQAVNNVQTAGSADGSTGTAFFDPPDTTGTDSTGAAAAITVALTSGDQIASAANGGAAGDNSNLTNMIDLQNQDIINGVTPDNAFSNLTFSIGNTISQANSDATASGNILTQLQNQQNSVEGVSLDEETSNLMLYERTYQSAAKVISTIDTLMGNVLDMGVTDPGY